MIRPPSDNLARKALLLIAIGCAALGVSVSKPVAFDLAFGRTSGHALVQIGFASFRLAFDSGQKCPNSNSCTGGVL
ncbi:hypothetical protein IAG41_08835 [Sphingomonas sp. JC676]|uniref:hypothetical protein n=1 Tax=Sphingomonas sp. JC676 TaxID=2768065 RepID=UPI0016581BAF|nr:hypothetical protein [Sphingomonas sp. JC676]MBC9032494.1 hypothetical protein [Sphingomonas sp. JC676]